MQVATNCTIRKLEARQMGPEYAAPSFFWDMCALVPSVAELPVRKT